MPSSFLSSSNCVSSCFCSLPTRRCGSAPRRDVRGPYDQITVIVYSYNDRSEPCGHCPAFLILESS